MKVWDYLQLGFAQHALIAATLIAIISGLIGPFVVSRDMAFAVHGSAELAFTGAAAGLLIAGDAVGGALIGSLVVGSAIGLLGNRASERNTAIGVVLAFGLGLGVLLLSFYRGFATAAIGTKIYTFGGEGNPDAASKGVFDNVEVYDTATDAWTKLPPMRIPRHGSYAAEARGLIYIPGGGTASGTPCTDAFDAYTP